ncbi:hypothetical protein C943_00341 [Mariniradius saccharolyticus AK6]|uniref:Uncharacterized protein n=1 Tax=Mariniradius saccharolyticus AK6 TaxID=1239962 RepID=M7XDV1_9BACT|nr:hypothetical protein C943_00341 [Mariniradius saccharolyticus AK6]
MVDFSFGKKLFSRHRFGFLWQMEIFFFGKKDSRTKKQDYASIAYYRSLGSTIG